MKQSYRMRLAVDFDGTCVRLTDAALALLNFKHGTKHTAYDIKRWDWPSDFGWEMSEFWDAVDVIHKQGWTVALRHYDDDLLECLPRIVRRFQHAVILTGKHKKHHGEVEAWLGSIGLDLPIVTPNNGTWIPAEEKMTYEWDILIDDAPSLVYAMLNASGDPDSGCLILMAAPWNRREREALWQIKEETGTLPANIRIANGWREAEAHIVSILNQATERTAARI